VNKLVLFLVLGSLILCALFGLPLQATFAQDGEPAEESTESAEVESAVVAEEEGPNEFFFFLGRFHPIALHSPIGILTALFLFEVIVLVFIRDQFVQRNTARWVLLTLGAASAVAAATLGVFLSWSAGYNEDLVFWHKWTGIAVAVAAVVACGLRVLYERSQDPSYNWGYFVSLLVAVTVLMPAGHFGAGLTHGTDYLTKYLPEQMAFLAPILGEAKSGEIGLVDDSIFGNEILPILEGKCFECHGVEKQDGDLRLDDLGNVLEGGESGLPSIVQGEAMESHMVKLMLLPEENEDVMPPRGKAKLTPEETLTLIEWVNRGAPWGEYEAPQPVVVASASIDPSEVDPADMEPKAILEIDELMKMFFEKQFEDLRRSVAEEPSKRSQLRAIYRTTYSLAEAHNLLFDLDEDYFEEEFIEADVWGAYVVKGRQYAGAIGDALNPLDYPLVKERFVALVNSCNSCHEEYADDVDPITVEVPAEKEPAKTEDGDGQ
jgi:uncharacterized membrane protein